ncbi:hypothetical protein M569_07223 [Genlisea aurea]|uniref:EF-hand domain-containing protein n=1 Tax=Genlisea aurea TaxID=192259 RepID=S8DWI4_9LAMI|nr:hypothetical protein M569_07223 [Genlisea aurea]
MGKFSVLLIYVVIAVFLLLVIIRSPENPRGLRRRHRRLTIRSNFTFTPPADPRHRAAAAAFDPLVADIELKREDKEWEHQYFQTHHPEFRSESPEPEWEDYMNAEDYLNNEERFNVTNRLVLLFPKIDVDPPDGYVSHKELTEWYLQQSQKEVFHRTEREMEIHDKDKDGFVSFQEYDPPSWVKNSGESAALGYDMGWWKHDHFNASDADGDGLLNITEFNDFLHPADSANPALRLWLCQEEIRERDSDKDGKMSFHEFFHGLFHSLSGRSDEENHNSSSSSSSSHLVSDDEENAPAQKLFNQLDKDGDGYLSDVELLAVIGQIHPGERYYAEQQTEYIMQQADSDGDGRLSPTEMIENPYVFYSAVFDDEDDEDDDGFLEHDEFR